MPLEGKASIYRSGKYKTLIHIEQAVVHDSAFPFAPGNNLRVRIDTARKRVIIEQDE
jgi:hypothetical protein